MDEPGPLFCPFCRECFDGERVCPDHELPLVPFHQLPRRGGGDIPRDDEKLAMYDVRFGRGVLMAAAALTLIGFALPFITHTSYETLSWTAIDAASQRAAYLWAVPLVGMAWASILARRRTPREMRSMRVVVPIFSLFGATALVYAISRIQEGAVQRTERTGEQVTVDLEIGVWVLAGALLMGALSAIRLGVLPRPDPQLPHGGIRDDDAEDLIDHSE